MPILKTKLYRPQVPADYVPRPRLLDLLERSCDTPLTLVSAPAGYGKSTLVSAWLETSAVPTAWLSLDEGDSSLSSFLRYFVAAVRSLAPEACPGTLALISGPSLPPTSVIADELLAELDCIEDPFVLVLDDLGFIKEPKVHELLTRILKQDITTSLTILSPSAYHIPIRNAPSLRTFTAKEHSPWQTRSQPAKRRWEPSN